MRNKKLEANVSMAVSKIFGGFNMNALKFLLPLWMSPLTGAAIRCTFAAAAFWIIGWFMPKEQSTPKEKILLLLVADFMFSEVGLLLEALVPASAMDTVKSMIQILLRCIILVIVAVFLAIGYFFGGIAGALVFTCAASAGIGGAISLIYPWMLHQGR